MPGALAAFLLPVEPQDVQDEATERGALHTVPGDGSPIQPHSTPAQQHPVYVQ